jgi:hypothetical protein
MTKRLAMGLVIAPHGRLDIDYEPRFRSWHLTDISIRHLSMSDVGGQSGPRRGSLAISNFGRCWLIKRTFR